MSNTTKKTTKKEVGAPRKEINWEVVDAVLQYKASLIDVADLCDVHPDTLKNRIKEKYDMNFKEYRDKKMSKMRLKLSQKQFEIAMRGNVRMLIWLGKQYLGQSEKVEQTTEIAVNPTQIELRAKKD